MLAAIREEAGRPPRAGDFREPDGAPVAEILAAGLNPVDLAIADGAFGTLTLPSVAGLEGIARLPGGERVYFGRVGAPFGSMAQRAPIDPGETFPVPEALADDALAVALGIAGLAAWLPLAVRGRLQAGERVLILGATGTVGRIAVQVARLLGAGRVVAAARDARALATLDADDTVDLRRSEDLAGDFVRAAAGGFDLILDTIYGPPLEAALGATAQGARVICIGRAAGEEITLPIGQLYGRTIIGHSNGDVPFGQRLDAYAALAEHAAAGRLRVDIERFALADVAQAWERQRAGGGHAKLVIIP